MSRDRYGKETDQNGSGMSRGCCIWQFKKCVCVCVCDYIYIHIHIYIYICTSIYMYIFYFIYYYFFFLAEDAMLNQVEG